MGSTLVHVGIRATDLDESIHFWRDLLELTIVDSGELYYDLTDGYHNFRIFEYQGNNRQEHVGKLNDYLHIGVYVSDIQDTIDRFEEFGYEPFVDGVEAGDDYDPNDPPDESLMIEDPDGIVIDVSDQKDQWPGSELPREEE